MPDLHGCRALVCITECMQPTGEFRLFTVHTHDRSPPGAAKRHTCMSVIPFKAFSNETDVRVADKDGTQLLNCNCPSVWKYVKFMCKVLTCQ